MKTSVKSSDFVNYNANDRNKNVGDCVRRTLSLAFNKDYREVVSLLNHYRDDLNWDSGEDNRYKYNSQDVYRKYIKTEEGSGPYKSDEPITVGELADQLDGTLIVECGKELGELVTSVLDENLAVDTKVVRTYQSFDNGDAVTLNVRLEFPNTAIPLLEKNVVLKYSPFEQLDEYLIKVKSKTEKELTRWCNQVSRQVYEYLNVHGNNPVEKQESVELVTPAAKRTYGSLPLWARSLVYRIDKYRGEYIIDMKPLSGDPNQEDFRLICQTRKQLDYYLKRYKETRQRPWLDYDPFDDYVL